MLHMHHIMPFQDGWACTLCTTNARSKKHTSESYHGNYASDLSSEMLLTAPTRIQPQQ